MAPRVRVLVDNDFAGDPDGLVQLAHHALSPSVDLVGVVASHLRAGDPWDRTGGRSAAAGAEAARRVLALAGRDDVPVVAGTETPLTDVTTPVPSAAVDLVLAEARRADAPPLVLVCGAGLTEVASALLTDREVAQRLTVVWIGGPEHPDLAAPPPGAGPVEYNLAIDVTAGTVVFDSAVPLWQVPRDAYRQVLAGWAEMEVRMGAAGPLGAHLLDALRAVTRWLDEAGLPGSDTYCLGDSPLVLLTSLVSPFEPDSASSRWVERPRPGIGPDGAYVERGGGARQRVYTHLDTRLLLEDLYARLALHARTGASTPAAGAVR